MKPVLHTPATMAHERRKFMRELAEKYREHARLNPEKYRPSFLLYDASATRMEKETEPDKIRLAEFEPGTIVPNKFNYTHMCSACGLNDNSSRIQVGEFPDYESSTAYLCKKCLLDALEESLFLFKEE